MRQLFFRRSAGRMKKVTGALPHCLRRLGIRGVKIISVQARAILVGGGNIHCITQQIPAGKRRNEQNR
ncbi:MAG: agmatine deiminase family protein [Oliverpabstia sp.]